MKPPEKLIIIGAGPAGIACAVQLKRYGLDPLLLEKELPGGLLKNAWRMDNYPGFPDGISGIGLVEKMKAHLSRFEVRLRQCKVTDVIFADDHFLLKTDQGELNCQILVVASGTRPKHTVPAGSENIFTEVYPIRDVRDKIIDIVGAGDAAFDYAMTLAKHNEVHIHNRGTQIKCVPALHKITLENPNIHYHENSIPSDSSDYTIFATGRKPDLGFLSEELGNNITTYEQEGLLYVIGDVKNGMVRQTSVATGDGIKAAMAIVEKIKLDESNQ